jgi:hypothetical protein
MGVTTYLLDRRTTTLEVGGASQTVGTLRRFFKLTELDDERAAELEAAERNTHSPVAALVMDIHEMPVAAEPSRAIAAHLVLGWDEGRGSVTDFDWDYLPRLGYAVRNPGDGSYVLHEEKDGFLCPIDASRARELGLLDANDQLVRHGQPRITACENVRSFLDKYADAVCTFTTGDKATLMIAIDSGELPPSGWFVGKRPMDVRRYPADPKPTP